MKRFIIVTFPFALLLFVFSYQAFAQKVLDAAIEDLANQIGSSITIKKQIKKVGVIPFSDLDGRISSLGGYLSESLTNKFVNMGNFVIVEKQKTVMGKLSEELEKHERGGHIDPSTIKRVGLILGLDAIVTGTITDLQSHVAVNCRLIDIQTGMILAMAFEKIIKDEDVKKLMAQSIREEKEVQPFIKEESTKRASKIDIKQTLYFGGDWLTVMLDSIELVEEKFLRFNFTVRNPFENEVNLSLYRPQENTYLVDNYGNSYDYVSTQGFDANRDRQIRPGERFNFSIVFKAPQPPTKRVALRTEWRAYGRNVHDTKKFVEKNLLIPGR